MASGETPHNLAALMKAQLSESQGNLLWNVGQFAEGMGMSVYLVGGPVRDMLLRQPSADFDVVVEGNGLQFAVAVAERQGLECSVHERFMTATLRLPNGGELDVATARREKYQFPGALPTVQPASLDEDLWRRDFSINAMAVGLNESDFGQLYDPCGGYSDLEEGIVRILHAHSFRDDPTRIIRAVDCEVRFGFRMNEHTESRLTEAVRQGALAQISPQRCRDALLPMLEIKPVVAGIVRLGELGVLAALGLSEVVSEQLRSILQQVPDALGALHTEKPGPMAALVYLSLLTHWAGTDATTVAAHIHLTGDEQKTVDNAAAFLNQPPSALSAPDIRPSELYFALEALSAVGAAALWAAQRSLLDRRRIEEFWHHLHNMQPDIDGNDLIREGAEPGPRFAAGLRAALRLKLDNPQATAEQQLRAALAYLAKADKRPKD